MSSKPARQIALIGEPNVGKSTLFTRLTGVGVISSNYPGTTVEFEEATLLRNGMTLHFHDLPGTYSLATSSEDERVVVEMLEDVDNDMIIVVGDAADIAGSITLCYEVMELGVPVVFALNRIDVASKRFTIDFEGLSKDIGVPVLGVSAKTGKGVDELLDVIISDAVKPMVPKVEYGPHIRAYIDELMGFMDDGRISKRGRAIKCLEAVEEFLSLESEHITEAVHEMSYEFKKLYDEELSVQIASDRFVQASKVMRAHVQKKEVERTLSEKLSDITINPLTGFPILIGVLVSMLAILVYAGEYLDLAVNWLYDTYIGTAIPDIGRAIGGEIWVAVFTGIDESFRAIFCLVIPYIMVFYIILGLLEDTGYLPRVVVLLDRSLHRFGLHGGGFIPMMVGLGCNVPAVMATRSASSKRERRILCSLIVMCVPCSAQLAIVIGTTGAFAGFQYSLLIILTLFLMACVIGVFLNRVLPLEPSNLAMELPELTVPSIKNILFKMWNRTSDFFSIAVPILVIGSIIVEIMMTYDLLNPLVEPMSWLTVTLLGLPPAVILGFIIGILRKEMAYGVLLILAGGVPINHFMDPHQFVVFGIVMATYIPCLATLSALGKELGAKDTIIITLTSMVVAIALGTLYNFALAPIMG